MNDETRSNVRNPETWKRLLFMVLFAIVFNVVELILLVIVVFQFLMTLFTGAAHARTREFGTQLGAYLEQVVCYLTYGTDTAPFPFDEWPAARPGAGTPPEQ